MTTGVWRLRSAAAIGPITAPAAARSNRATAKYSGSSGHVRSKERPVVRVVTAATTARREAMAAQRRRRRTRRAAVRGEDGECGHAGVRPASQDQVGEEFAERRGQEPCDAQTVRERQGRCGGGACAAVGTASCLPGSDVREGGHVPPGGAGGAGARRVPPAVGGRASGGERVVTAVQSSGGP